VDREPIPRRPGLPLALTSRLQGVEKPVGVSMKDDWRIGNYRKLASKDVFLLTDAAYYWHDAEPEKHENIPAETLEKINETYDILKKAAKEGTLYESEFRSGGKIRHTTVTATILPGDIGFMTSPYDLKCRGLACREDLIYFAGILGEKPKFLFPEKRGTNPRKQKVNPSVRVSSEPLKKKMNVKEAAIHYQKSEDTIRRWVEEGRLLAEKDPGGRILKIIGLNPSFERISAATVKRTSHRE
jgi:hypothetical protein